MVIAKATNTSISSTFGDRTSLVVALGGYLLLLLAINLIIVPYPQDNDLDEIGWIAAHQSLSRLESLANQNYPFGYPLLLHVLTPVFGSLLTAAFVCSTIGATASVFFIFLITRHLSGGTGIAAAAAATAGIMLLPVATSEFADSITTALVLAGIYCVVKRPSSTAASLWFGASAGLCFLFRFHYVVFLVIGPAGLLVLEGPLRVRLRMIIMFLVGFIAGSFPLLIINTAVYGQPLYTGFSSFMFGQFAKKSLDWNNFLATYNLWPLGRVIREDPAALLQLLLKNGRSLITRPEVTAGCLLIPLTVSWALPPDRRRSGGFIAAVLVLYIGTVLLPSRFTPRAFALATSLLCVLSFPSLARLAELFPIGFYLGRLPVVRTAYMAAVVLLLFVGTNIPIQPLLGRHQTLLWNRGVLDAMRAQGWGTKDKVFCNFWDFYNLDDPGFITFHNYGGYMLLDSLYKATMPQPDAQSAAEWEVFLDRHGIRFVIAESNRLIQDFLERRDAAKWSEIYRDQKIVVLKRAAI